MPKKTLHEFSIQHLSILDPQGKVDPHLEPKLSKDQLKTMFRQMLLTREFDRRATQLQRQGRLGTYASATGQEAIHIGSATAMDLQDWAVPCFREQGVYLARGIKASSLFLFFMGSEEGNRFPPQARVLPYCVPCASQVLHAVGIGMAAKIKKEPVAVITYLGDGATSEGDFHEGLNFASVYQAPVVILCQNNHWAISTPTEKQFVSKTLAQRAIAYGMPGLQVDGNDVLAVYAATQQALARAKAGQGPTFLECVTYRMDAHTTSDDPTRYRSEQEVQVWKSRDPVARFEKYLLGKKILHPGEKEMLQQELGEQLKQQAAEAQAISERLSPDEIFSYLYQETPTQLQAERSEAFEQEELEEGVLHA